MLVRCVFLLYIKFYFIKKSLKYGENIFGCLCAIRFICENMEYETSGTEVAANNNNGSLKY
jgi:hypothetical protein